MAVIINPSTYAPGSTETTPAFGHAIEIAQGLLVTTRPYQWVKNVAVLIVPGLAILTLGASQILSAGLAVLAFCLAASSVYLLNDTVDRSLDRVHPKKRLRPIASGLVPPKTAIAATAVLGGASLAVGYAVSMALGLIVASYLLFTAGYSLALKHVAIVDVAILAAGFVLRVLGGAIAIGLLPSSLLLLAVFAAAAMIALGKRHAEVALLGEQAATHRSTLTTYTPAFLRRALVDMQLVSVGAFGLWVYTASSALLAPVIALIAAFSLYAALGHYRRSLVGSGIGGDPTRDLVGNSSVLAGLAIAGLSAFSIGLF